MRGIAEKLTNHRFKKFILYAKIIKNFNFKLENI